MFISAKILLAFFFVHSWSLESQSISSLLFPVVHFRDRSNRHMKRWKTFCSCHRLCWVASCSSQPSGGNHQIRQAIGWLPHWKTMALYVIPNRRAGARGQHVLWLQASGGINSEKTHKSLRLDVLASPICPKWTGKWEEWLGDHDYNYHSETDIFWYCTKQWFRHKGDHYCFRTFI